MNEININENNEKKLADLFQSFLDEHNWSSETKMACTYSFFHTLNLINSNLRKTPENVSNKVEYTFDNDTAKIRNDVLEEAINAIKSCELVAPNVRRIRLDEAVGALIGIK